MVFTKSYYVYLLTNWNNKVIYIGVTNDLNRRLYEHKNKIIQGFTQKYNLNKLVYFEETNDINAAITREKEIKKWRREKKDKLVNQLNPNWIDLSEQV
jgi:putative endonuclease